MTSTAQSFYSISQCFSSLSSVFCLPVKLCPAAAVVSATWLNPVFLEWPRGVKSHDTQWAKEIMKCQVDCTWVVVTHNIHDPGSKNGLAFHALVHMNSLYLSLKSILYKHVSQLSQQMNVCLYLSKFLSHRKDKRMIKMKLSCINI